MVFDSDPRRETLLLDQSPEVGVHLRIIVAEPDTQLGLELEELKGDAARVGSDLEDVCFVVRQAG